MSAFEDVRRATCQVLKNDGQTHNGTAFCILPDGTLLTCHHVIAGLTSLKVKLQGSSNVIDAQYLADRSDPDSDLAVLKIPPDLLPAVQLARARDAATVYGYGYRPKTLQQEPEGHSFSGRLSPGQVLQVANRRTDVRNLEGAGGLEPGISGGPIYDPGLRCVVGLFRAVEGDQHAFVIPIDTLFERWPDLALENQNLVKDQALDDLQQYFGIQRIAEGATPVRPAAVPYFARLAENHKIFGGRQADLRTLNDFLEQNKNPYLFVSGLAGFGKTALLINWAWPFVTKSVAATGLQFAVHFLSKQVSQSAEEHFVFGNLCEQLMAAHGLGGELPQENRKRRALYSQLLRLAPPPGTNLVVLIDGLDEALGHWEPDSDMFPELPEGTKVVFSARDIADRNWLEFLKLDLPAGCILRVGQLDRAGVSEVLQSARPGDWKDGELSTLADQVWSISQGDPFYVHDLLADLKATGYDPSQLPKISHSEYLNLWWKGAEVNNPAFVDLMGMLAVVLGPMTKQELASVDETDQLRDINISELIESAARYIIGSATTGYQISTTRIQQFVSARFGSDLRKYKHRIAGYCLRWAELDANAQPYVWLHAVQHLADAGTYDDLFALIDANWLGAKWTHYGSYAGVISDIDATAAAALARDPPDIARIAGLAIARATAREVMAQFPAAVLTALVRLGNGVRVIELVQAERIVGGPPERLFRIAKELALTLSTVDQPDLAPCLDFVLDAVTNLLWTAGRSFDLRLLEQTMGLLGNVPGSNRVRFAQDMASRSDDLPSVPFRCAVLSLLSVAVAEVPDSDACIVRWSQQAEALIASLRDSAGHLVATSYFWAMQSATGQAGDLLQEATAELLAAGDYLQRSGWIEEPVLIFMQNFPFASVPDKAGALNLLRGIADRLRTEDRGSVELISAVTGAFLGLREQDAALGFIGDIYKRFPEVGARAVVQIAAKMHAVDPQACLGLIEQTAAGQSQSQLSIAWARAGEWGHAIEISSTALSSDIPADHKAWLIRELLSLLTEQPTEAVHNIVEDLLASSESFDRSSRAEIYGAAATALASVDQTAATRNVREAIALQLAAFPTGDTDRLREFLTIAFNQESKHAEAARVAGQIKLEEVRVSALSKLVRLTPATDATGLRIYAAAVADFLAGQGAGASFDALRIAISLLAPLTEKAPEAVGSLRAHVEMNGRHVLDLMSNVFRGFVQRPERLGRMGWPSFRNLVDLTSQLFSVDPDKAGAVLTDVWHLASAQPPQVAILIQILFAKAVPVPAILVTYAPLIKQALDRASERRSDEWTAAVTDCAGPAIAQLSGTDPELGTALMSSLLDTILTMENPLTLSRAVSNYWWNLAHSSAYPDLAGKTLAATLSLPQSEERIEVFSTAAQVLFLNGGRPAAQVLFDGIGNPPERQFAEGGLKTAESLAELGELSTLEQLYTAHGSGLPIVVMNDIRSGNAKKILETFTRALANDLIIGNRQAVLDAGVWTALLPVLRTSGSAAVEAIINAIDDFDQRFVDAGKLLTDPSRAALRSRA